jgi:hypothetical protein
LYLHYLEHQNRLTGHAPHPQVVDVINSSVGQEDERDGIQQKASAILTFTDRRLSANTAAVPSVKRIKIILDSL